VLGVAGGDITRKYPFYLDLREREARIRRLGRCKIVGDFHQWNLEGEIIEAMKLLQMVGYQP